MTRLALPPCTVDQLLVAASRLGLTSTFQSERGDSTHIHLKLGKGRGTLEATVGPTGGELTWRPGRDADWVPIAAAELLSRLS